MNDVRQTCLGPPSMDISRTALEDSLSALAEGHRDTPMLGICCDHSQLEGLPTHPWLIGERRIGFFPGSSLGNFTPKDAVLLLQRFRHLLAGGPLLLGLDQPRDPALLEAAYDDAAGISKAFAFNLLKRLNRDLQGNALPKNFRYQARWQADQQRIEMSLVSRCAQTIQLAESALQRTEAVAVRASALLVLGCCVQHASDRPRPEQRKHVAHLSEKVVAEEGKARAVRQRKHAKVGVDAEHVVQYVDVLEEH